MASLWSMNMATKYLLVAVLVLRIFTAVSQTLPRHYDYGFTPCVQEPDGSSHYILSGQLGDSDGNGSTQGDLSPRLEIRQLQQDEELWTLYLLGLDLLQSYNQTEVLSWFQISGIHGRPYQSWDGVEATPGNEQSGYCTHTSILFPTWHRPYLALYEQILYDIIQEIASYYEYGHIRRKYIKAARRFRIPYWDWAAVPPSGQSVLPASVGGSPVVDVDGPNGTQTIANPLFSYYFSPLDTTQIPDPPFNQWPQTLRYPTSRRASATSRNSLVAQILDISAQSLRSRLYNLLTNYPSYTAFSNEAFIASLGPEGHDSIESLHDQIHGITGSGGHMTYIDYAAFDPIFVLHHTMVDRCFALWQVLNPDSFVVPQPAVYSSFTTSAGEIEDDSTALTPFRRDAAGTFWTSSSARQTETFSYTYPETANPKGLSAAQIQTQVTTAINQLYGNPISVSNSTNSSSTRLSRPRSNTATKADTYQEWIANLRVSRAALPGPITIYLLLSPDPLPADPLQWSLSPHLVGSQSVFTRSSSASSSATQEITATIPLTAKLHERFESGELDGLDGTVVEAYLRQFLRVRVVGLATEGDTAYRVVKGNQASAVGVTVVSALVERARSLRDLPVWGPLGGGWEVGIGE